MKTTTAAATCSVAANITSLWDDTCFEIFTKMTVHIVVFYVVTLSDLTSFAGACCIHLPDLGVMTPRSHVGEYQCYGGIYCLQLQGFCDVAQCIL